MVDRTTMLSQNDKPRASFRGGEQERRLQEQRQQEVQDAEELSEAYVHSLASLGLERLQNEPARLHAEAIAVDEALHSLSLDHYRVFIQNQECVRHVRARGQEMDEHLSSLLAEVHGLSSEFSVFQREAAELVGGHKRNRQTLKHHMQLVELLEVPQLMDACVRSDLIEEALSIATFASTLERRHRSRRVATSATSSSTGNAAGAPATPTDETDEGHLPGVIKMIVDEVRESAKALHERLLAKLRGSIQLTSCLQVVSCLRRLELLALEEKLGRKQHKRQQKQDAGRGTSGGAKQSNGGSGGGGGVSQRQLALVDMKLQVDFLEARDAWLADSASRASNTGDLQQALGGGSSSGPYQSLMDLIESSRSQWFEVATQFRAIFLTDGSGGGGDLTGKVECGGSGDVLSLWLLRRVTAFVGQLKAVLPLIEDGASLRSLLEECMFFGASMGRLGTDFRGLLVPVFEERVIGAAAEQWATASADFVVTLRDVAAVEAAGGNGSSLLHVPEKNLAASISAVTAGKGLGAAEGRGGGRSDVEASLLGDDAPPSPPRSLMAFPPVARLVNQLLTSFNQLRECLPVSVEARLREGLVRCFSDAFRALADLQKTTVRVSAATAAASGASPLSVSRARGSAAPLTTVRAVELTCAAFAEQAVPHVALCFAFLFGERPSSTSTLSSSLSSTTTTPSKADRNPLSAGAAAAAGKGKENGRRELLQSQLLDSMEKFGIYEKPAPPPPPAVVLPAQSEGLGLADKPPPRSRDILVDDNATGDEAPVASTTETDLPPASGVGAVPFGLPGGGGGGEGAVEGAIPAAVSDIGAVAQPAVDNGL